MATTTLKFLVDAFSQVSIASLDDNKAILKFIDDIPMQMNQGGLKFDRNPSYFALSGLQGEKSYTFLFKNSDGSVTGIGGISIVPMRIKGQDEYLGYCSDLRFNSQIEPMTKKQFYQFYAVLIENFRDIQELEECKYIITTIFDENTAAVKALVDRKNRSRTPLVHRPVFAYNSVNVIARVPGLQRLGGYRVSQGQFSEKQILDFLTSNPEESELVWSEKEILRRKKEVGFSFSDFLTVTDASGELLGCSLLLTDSKYRKIRVSNLSWRIRMSSLLMPLLGRPKIQESEPVRTGYLSFFKLSTKSEKRRSQMSAALLKYCFQNEVKLVGQSLHSMTVTDSQSYNLGSRLHGQGFLSVVVPATSYQVIHKKHFSRKNLFYKTRGRRPDFDVTFF